MVFAGLIGLGVLLFLAARLYKSAREKRGE
jgi:hypothetical protein